MQYLRSLVAAAVLVATVLGTPTPSPAGLTWTDDHESFSNERSLLPTHDTSLTKRQISPSTWSPPSNLVTPLQQVWDHEVQTYNMNFRNFGFDQLIDAKGSINICVRWESNTSVTAADRTAVEAAYKRSYEKWMQWLYKFDSFPFSAVNVKVVGWAVRSTGLLQGSTSGLDVYTTTDSDGIPQCAPACGRFFHQDNNYSQCPGGAARHYDHSLWLTDGFGGGAGGDWGQRIGREYFMSNLNTANIHILLHEMGHTYALDDFYDWTPSGVSGFIMKAGSASQITDFDGWMLRDWWRHLKTRYNLSSPPASTPASTPTSTRTSTTTVPTPGTGTAPLYGQCGGSGWTGPTTCAQGTCKAANEWYSQCVL
ncbi:hypothetical protein HGRIS_000643 [Hohenbuehelia grisea]|uniref:CBM1 domain-containing protein n=1 Tax=Hohenbuehelia grisea TaxID=104357 RepID=A0ABR3JRT6_9AGAR